MLLQTGYLKMGRLEHSSTPLYLVLNWLKVALGGMKVLLPQTALACPTKALGRMQKDSNAGRLCSRHEEGYHQCKASLSPSELSAATGEIRGGPRVGFSHQSHLLHMPPSCLLPVTTSNLSSCFTSQRNLFRRIALIIKHICWWECKLV